MCVPRAVAVSLGLLGGLAALALSVHVGLWRAVDQAAVSQVVASTPCVVLRAGYGISPWLSAELSLVYATLLALLVGWRSRRWGAAWLLAGLLATAPVEVAAKHVVDQPPPRRVLDLQRPDCGREGYALTVVPTPQVFPSGSVTRLTYFATLVGAVAARLGRWRLPARGALVVATAAAAATRVPIGWHWPSDVLGGLLLGAAMAALALWLTRGATSIGRGQRGAP